MNTLLLPPDVPPDNTAPQRSTDFSDSTGAHHAEDVVRRPLPHPAPLLHLVLEKPAIAGNVGACVRLAAASGAALHVCGSELQPGDREMWRAGLDYWPHARVHFHRSLDRCLALLPTLPWLVEVGSDKAPWDVSFTAGDVVVVGPEKGSVDEKLRDQFPQRVLTLPQEPGTRSLNLSQVAAMIVYEAMSQRARRQNGS